MKTIEINLYSFEELSEDEQQIAINEVRNSISTDYIDEEAMESFKRFASIFSIEWRCVDWSGYRIEYIVKLDSNILELKGQRLANYIWNNYKKDLYKGKYFSLWSKTDVSFKHHKKGFPVLKNRHSNILLDNCCPLTGVCYDDALLQPLFNFIDKPYNIDFETLLSQCITSLCNYVSDEIEYRQSDEGVKEDIASNNYHFTIDGNIY